MRYPFYILAMLLLPALLCVLLWIRSHRVSDDVRWDRAAHNSRKWEHVQHGIYTSPGKLVYYRRPWVTYRQEGHPPKTGFSIHHYAPTDAANVFPGYSTGSGRFGFWGFKDFWVVGSKAVVIPFYAPTILGAMLGVPALLAAQRSALRAHRRRFGLCISCGYDLRESKERCPECGSPILLKKGKGIAPR